MIEDANRQLEGEGASEAGAFFGASEIENTRRSRYYTKRGLGNKGLGVVNAFHYRNLVLMEKIAGVLGKTGELEFFKERAE